MKSGLTELPPTGVWLPASAIGAAPRLAMQTRASAISSSSGSRLISTGPSTDADATRPLLTGRPSLKIVTSSGPAKGSTNSLTIPAPGGTSCVWHRRSPAGSRSATPLTFTRAFVSARRRSFEDSTITRSATTRVAAMAAPALTRVSYAGEDRGWREETT